MHHDIPPNPVSEKKVLRRELRARRSLLAPRGCAAARDASQRITEHLLGSDLLREAGSLAAYLAFGDELDVQPLVTAAEALGVRVCYPRVASTRPPRLTFHVMGDPDALHKSSFGVLEPGPDSPEVTDIDAMVVPGLGFDRAGHRLGYGAGFYDEALRSHPAAVRIAPCYEFQLLRAIPHDDHDEPVDLILTPTEILWTEARALQISILRKEELR